MARILRQSAGARIVCVVAVLATALTVARLSMYAQIDLDIFELDGNALDDDAVSGRDWNTVNGGSIAKTGVVPDPAPTTIFTTGGSKDDLDIDKWRHKTGSVPDKDDITNAYAVAYNSAAGDLLVYFGADRFANDGDAQLGFWFFQASVAPMAGGTFSGLHTIGDLLILANFSNGGAVATIEVLEWVGTGGDQGGGTLRRLVAPGVATCAPGFTGDICAIANLTPQTAPWSYVPKSGAAGTFPANSFFEGGINVSAIFAAQGQALPCFTSFLAETRSSTSVNATLKDFVAGQFPVCGVEITKICGTATLNPLGGFDYAYTGTVKNTGAGTLYDVTVSDPLGTPSTVNLGTLGPNETKNYGGSIVNSTMNGGFENTASVTAALQPGGAAAVSDSTSDACEPTQVSPSMSVTKECATELVSAGGQVTIRVNVSGQICNTSTVLTLSSLSATDNPPATIVIDKTTLAPNECAGFSGSYFPSSADPSPSLASFSDTVTVTAQSSHGGGQVQGVGSASCPLCPPCTGASCPQPQQQPQQQQPPPQ
jgi:hypothetical protein